MACSQLMHLLGGGGRGISVGTGKSSSYCTNYKLCLKMGGGGEGTSDMLTIFTSICETFSLLDI